ncbi:unnamed protein product, partial [Ectocarpus sp. 12 AP-2014]
PPAAGGIAGNSKVFLVPAALAKSGWTSPPPLLTAMTPTASTAEERASAAVSPAWRVTSSNMPFHPPAPLWSLVGSGIPARNSRPPPPPPLAATRSPEPNPRLFHAAAAACISEALSDLPGRPLLLLLLLPLGSCGRWYTCWCCWCCCSQTWLGALRSQAKPPPSAPSRSSKSPPPPPLLPPLRLPTGSYIGGRGEG